MGIVAPHLPDDLDEQLNEYAEAEDLDRADALRKLLADGLANWRTERAIEQLREDEVTFSRAAEIADRPVWEFADLVRERDVTWVAGEHVERDLADGR